MTSCERYQAREHQFEYSECRLKVERTLTPPRESEYF